MYIVFNLKTETNLNHPSLVNTGFCEHKGDTPDLLSHLTLLQTTKKDKGSAQLTYSQNELIELRIFGAYSIRRVDLCPF